MSGAVGADLLLRAIAGTGDEASDAGRAWLEDVVLDDVDPAQLRVLPMLYRSLADAGVSHIPPRVKGAYRQSWARNVSRARRTLAVIEALRKRGVPSLVVKGMALVDHYGDRWGARDMHDADLLVRACDATRAIDALVQDGWTPWTGATVTTIRARLLDHRGGWPFVEPGGDEIDLHWHLFHSSLGAGADDEVWAAAEDFQLHGGWARRPHPADLVLHACEQGSGKAEANRLACAADVGAIARSVGADAIAPRLVDQARRHSLLGSVRTFTAMVAEASRSPEVALLAARVAAARPGRLERAIDRHAAKPASRRSGLLASIRRQSGGRTRLSQTVRAALRERIEPGLTRRPAVALLHVVTGRRALIARALRRSIGTWTRTPIDGSAPVALGAWIDFTDPATVDRYGGPGWSYSGVDGTWTDGAEARVLLPVEVSPDADLVATIEVMPYCVAQSPRRAVEVRVDERAVARFEFDGATLAPGFQTLTMLLGGAPPRRAASLELSFVVDRPMSPAALGLSSDARRVGLMVRRLRVDAAAPHRRR